MRLRHYQDKGVGDIEASWTRGNMVVAYRLPTGGGKTPVFSEIAKRERGYVIANAHRTQLVMQMSMALAENDVRHTVVSKDRALVEGIIDLHVGRFGTSYFDPSSRVAVASSQALHRLNENHELFRRCSLFINDEGHHTLRDNMFGQVSQRMLNHGARGLIVSATFNRPDGKGMGAHAHGIADDLVLGPSEADLFEWGYLTPYRVKSIDSGIDLANVGVGAGGEYQADPLKKAVHAAKKLVGDVVKHYLMFARGKLGLTFCVDVETADKIAAEYNAAGVPAVVMTDKTPTTQRVRIMADFRARKLLQIVSIDILGEGVDIPAVEVVSMVRPTKSYIVYAQQLGRMLRLMLPEHLRKIWEDLTPAQRHVEIARSGKPFGLLLDHAGNYMQPEFGSILRPRVHTLDARTSGNRSSVPGDLLNRVCTNPDVRPEGTPGPPMPCAQPYERVLLACPFCGHVPVPAARSGPEHVDGDLVEVEDTWMADMWRKVAQIDGHHIAQVPGAPRSVIREQHIARQQAQDKLRKTMQWWGAVRKREGDSDREMQKRFYLRFGVDVMTAMTLSAREAATLTEKLVSDEPCISGLN